MTHINIGTYRTLGHIASDIDKLIRHIECDTERDNDIRELVRARDMILSGRDLIDNTIELEDIL